MLNNPKLKLGLPSPASRFFPDIAAFFKSKDINISVHDKKLTKALGDLEVIFLRGFDIPAALSKGWIDIGITGLDAVYEANDAILLIGNLGIRYSEVVFASNSLKDVNQLQAGDCIVSEYKKITRDFLLKKRMTGVHVTYVTGAAESYGYIKDIAGIITLKTTGQSLVDNKLNLIETLFTTQACLFANFAAYNSKYLMIKEFASKIGLKLNELELDKLSNM